MKSVADIHVFSDFVFLDTGSPHHICMVDDLENYPVKQKGAEIRYSSLYKTTGTNVNFVHQNPDKSFSLRTYERGVEDETLSCGTGATAVALAMHKIGKTTDTNIVLKVLGGTLEVSFDCETAGYENVFLKGPATFVFQGIISI
jgi:diaminopimelate epimerase